MFGNMNSSNNNTNSVNVNTKIKTWYSELSSMQLTYWNENIGIKINPLLSVSPEGLRQYDYQKRGNTAITQEKGIALYNEIKKEILPVLEKIEAGAALEKPVSVGFSVGKGNSQALNIELTNDEKGTPSMYLKYYTNIGADKKAPSEGTFIYKFNKSEIIRDYNPSTGEYKSILIEGEFTIFCKLLENMNQTLGLAAHSTNYEAASNLKRGDGFQSQSNSNQGFQQPASTYSAPVTNVGMDDSFLPFA